MSKNVPLVLSPEVIERCEAVLGYKFQDRQLLQVCLTHASGARHRLVSNERLEFLGDAVLGMVVCEMLYRRFPQATEGELTRIKSVLVSRHTCAKISLALGCHEFLLLGKGLSTSDTVPSSVSAAVLESLIAGVYLDGGLQAAATLIERILADELELTVQHEHGRNFKSQLQQIAQRQFGATPFYKLLDEKGPDHSKCFQVMAVIGEQTFTAAWGTTKKEAEQRAAENAFQEIQKSNASDVTS